MEENDERTLEPTSLRLEEARRQGRVARSGELASALVLLAALGVMSMIAPKMLDAMVALVRDLLSPAETAAPLAGLAGAAWAAAGPMALMLGLMMLAVLAVAVGANLLQVGFLASSAPIMPDVSRISPIQGLRRLFSGRAAQRLVIIVLKLAAMAFICYAAIVSMIAQFNPVASVSELSSQAGGVIQGVLVRIALAMLVIGILDYLYQRWRHKADLQVSPRQMKEDLRQLEGDVQLRRKRAANFRRMIGGRLADVSRASVIVTAASGLVVAVRFAPTMSRPRVLAKASRRSGQELMRQARGAGVAIVEDDELAGELVRHCRVGQEIPRRLDERVAEVLAYAEHVGNNNRSNNGRSDKYLQAGRLHHNNGNNSNGNNDMQAGCLHHDNGSNSSSGNSNGNGNGNGLNDG